MTPPDCAHEWGPWRGTATHFRFCERCGACEINTTRPPYSFISRQPESFRGGWRR